MTGSEAAAASTKKSSPVKRFAPLVVLVIAIILVFALDLDRYVSFEALQENRDRLLAFVDAHMLLAPLIFVLAYALVIGLSIPGGAVMTIAGGFLFGLWLGPLLAFVDAHMLLAPLIFVLAYALVIGLSIPGGAVMTIAGGFLFGLWLGTLLVVVGATLGATMVFLIARTALGDVLREKAGARVRKMEEGFQEDAFNYLLVLRLIPIFPFWLVNIVPAVLGVPLTTYVAGTFLGIIPGSFVYASVGNGLGAVFDTGGTPDLGIIFSPQIMLPIVGLAILAILPVVYKKLKGRPQR